MQGYVDDYLGRNPVQLDSTLTDPEKAAPADVVGELKGDLVDIYESLNGKYQYLKQEDLVGGYYAWSQSAPPTITSNSNYKCYKNAIKLTKGVRYSFLNCDGDFSWIHTLSGNYKAKLSNVLSNGKYTPDNDYFLYVTISSATTNAMVVNDEFIPSEYVEGIYLDINSIIDTRINNVDGVSEQFLKESDKTANYYYAWASGKPILTQGNGYYAYIKPVKIYANKTYCLNGINTDFSWGYDSNGKAMHIGNGVFTPTKDLLLYITVNGNNATITNTNKLPSKYVEGLYIDKNNYEVYVKKDGSGDFTTLKDAISYANSHNNTTIIVGNGTYDLIEELGNSYFENLGDEQNAGLKLNNNVHIIFSSNSLVTCNYTGNNSNVKKYFSPFNSAPSEHSGFVLENLTLVCSNVRYGIHDETIGQIKPYKNEYINCSIKIDNSNNTQGYPQCIGGGLGSASEIIIKNCYFESVHGEYSAQIVTYHNGGNGRSNIVIDGCYFANKDTCRCSYYGDSTNISRMIVCNCSMGAEPTKIQESETYSNDNIELITWNNEIRNS